MKNRYRTSGPAVFMISGTATLVACTVIIRKVEARRQAREAREELVRNAVHTHFMDQWKSVNEILDQKIKIARAALLRDDIEQIFRDQEEL